MQWDAGPSAGFTSGTPWITPPDNYRTINVQAELQDPDSILNYYKRLIQLRKEKPVVAEGQIEFLFQDIPGVFAYRRFLGERELFVINNFTGQTVQLNDRLWENSLRKIIGNYPDAEIQGGYLMLRPFETVVFE